MQKNYSGALGAGPMESDKPVVLFDDFNSSYRDFNTLQEAIEAREKESFSNQWAPLKMIFEFSSATSQYERRG